jgi:hypothetical protein
MSENLVGGEDYEFRRGLTARSGAIHFAPRGELLRRELDMNNSDKGGLAVVAAFAATLVMSEPVFARGGAASIMDSPGYQRRLQESRRQPAQPVVPPSPAIRHKPQHRHRP